MKIIKCSLHLNIHFAFGFHIVVNFWHVNRGQLKYGIDSTQLDYIAFNLCLRPHIKATISTTSTPPSTNLWGSLTKSTMVHNHRKKNSNLHAIYNHTFYDMLYPKKWHIKIKNVCTHNKTKINKTKILCTQNTSCMKNEGWI